IEPAKIYVQLMQTAHDLAVGQDRSAIEAITRYICDPKTVPQRASGPRLSSVVCELVVLEIADAENKCGLKSGLSPYLLGLRGDCRLPAIDCYHDDASRRFFVEMALPGGELSDAPGALRLLRGYELEGLRDILNEALRREQERTRELKSKRLVW